MVIGKSKTKSALLVAVVAGCLGTFAGSSSAGLARLGGGSGYSGHLAKNKAVREQQLICDPTGDPIAGSSSVTYDPYIVSLTGFSFGPGYTGQGFVEVETSGSEGATVLQSLTSFLRAPEGTQTGYAQMDFTLTGTPGTVSPKPGFTLEDSAGVAGVDTHCFTFTYLKGVPDYTNTQYTIFADTANQNGGNKADFLTGVTAGGKKFTLGPSQLSSATVSGNLVPLPPAVWTGSGMLLALLSAAAIRKIRAASRVSH